MMKQENMRIVIYGLGLLGGSFAFAIKKQLPSWYIIGFDADKKVGNESLSAGGIDTLVTREALLKELSVADLVILAVPILAIIDFINIYKDSIKKSAVICDVGSTKSQIIEAASEVPLANNFVGGHPMTGMVTANVNGPSPELFKERLFIITPSVHTNKSAVKFITSLVETIGGVPLTMHANQHDFIVALVSHLPYLLPVLLLQTNANSGEKSTSAVAAGGFKSIAANAGHNIPMWEDILTTNSEGILKALSLLEDNIHVLKKLLSSSDELAIREYLEATVTIKKQFV